MTHQEANPQKIPRRALFTQELPKLGIGMLAVAAGGGEPNRPVEDSSEHELLDSIEAQRVLFEGKPMPDKFSDRATRMQSLYPIAVEAAARLFTDEVYAAPHLTFLHDKHYETIASEHSLRSQFTNPLWIIHGAIVPSSFQDGLYANVESGDPWHSTNDWDADLEFTLMSIAAQLQSKSVYQSNPSVSSPDQTIHGSWGSYLYTSADEGQLFQRFGDGLNLKASRELLLKQQWSFVHEYPPESPQFILYKTPAFFRISEDIVSKILERLNLEPEYMARIAIDEGAQAIVALLESTYVENGFDTQTDIDPKQAAWELITMPDMVTGDSYQEELHKYETIVQPTINRLLPMPPRRSGDQSKDTPPGIYYSHPHSLLRLSQHSI